MTVAGLLLVLLIAALGVRIAWILARPKPIEHDEHQMDLNYIGKRVDGVEKRVDRIETRK